MIDTVDFDKYPEFDTFENKKMLTKSVVVRSVSIFYLVLMCAIFFSLLF